MTISTGEEVVRACVLVPSPPGQVAGCLETPVWAAPATSQPDENVKYYSRSFG